MVRMPHLFYLIMRHEDAKLIIIIPATDQQYQHWHFYSAKLTILAIPTILEILTILTLQAVLSLTCPDSTHSVWGFTRLPGFSLDHPDFHSSARISLNLPRISHQQPDFWTIKKHDALNLPTCQKTHYPIPAFYSSCPDFHAMCPGFHVALPGFARICPDLPGFARICPDLPGFARIARISNHQAGYLSHKSQSTPLTSISVDRWRLALRGHV